MKNCLLSPDLTCQAATPGSWRGFFFLFTPSPLRLSHSCSLVLKRVKHLHLLLLQFLAGYAAGEGGRVEGGVLIFPLLARVFRRSLVT